MASSIQDGGSGRASADLQNMLRHNIRLDRIDYVPIEQLKFHSRRLRKRSADAVAALERSVQSFGIVLPVLIDQQNTIVGGEGTVEAARNLGHRDVPIVRIDHLDEGEVRLLRIALNKLGETSEWNKVELKQEFEELLSMDLELHYEVTGFSTVEIDNLVHAPAAVDEEDPDDIGVPLGEPGSAISQLGDLWMLGDHRVLCGSSLEMDNLVRLMAGRMARMVLTDAPFNVKISGHVSGLGSGPIDVSVTI